MKHFQTLWFIGLSFFSTTTVLATPSSTIWHRENLLGCNETHCYSLVIKRENPSSYFEFTETLSLAQYEISSNQLVEQIVIRKTRHIDKEANNNWTTEEQQTTAFDLNKYLIDNQLSYVFSVDMSEIQITTDPEGLFLQEEDKKVVLLSKERLVSIAPWFDQYSKIAHLYELKNNYYVILEQGEKSGEFSPDLDFQQALIIIPGEIYQKAWQAFSVEKQPEQKYWQVQVGCFRGEKSAKRMMQYIEEKTGLTTEAIFSEESDCHRIILTPRQTHIEAAKQQVQQLQDKLKIKGFIAPSSEK